MLTHEQCARGLRLFFLIPFPNATITRTAVLPIMCFYIDDDVLNIGWKISRWHNVIPFITTTQPLSRFLTAVFIFLWVWIRTNERDVLLSSGGLYGDKVSATSPSPSTRFRLASSSFEDCVIKFIFAEDSSVGELLFGVGLLCLQSMLQLYTHTVLI